MRRLARHLFTCCAAASLLLSLAGVVFWLLSYRTMYFADAHRVDDLGNHAFRQRIYRFRLSRGQYLLERQVDILTSGATNDPRIDTYHQSLVILSRNGGRSGFSGKTPNTVSLTQINSQYRWTPLVLARYGIDASGGPSWFGTSRVILVHAWMPPLVLALPPLAWIVSWRRRRALRHLLAAGRCRQCRYDLRAHRGGDRCPECGTPANTNDAADARRCGYYDAICRHPGDAGTLW
jgi:hypothetical protein